MDPSHNEPALTTVFVDSKPSAKRIKRAKLVVVEGPDRGKEVTLERERVSVGRSIINDVVLSDKAVSGSHFEIVAGESGHVLRDLDSTNGTYCGDLRIREIYLKPGVQVRAGQSVMAFQPLEGVVQVELSQNERFSEIIGRSVKMREIFATLEKVAPSELTVMVEGETGTGKELVARAVHQFSKRAHQPFVVQDCSAIPKELIESTLFGHEKGSFTGASERHRGCFESADGGTIFLDEIGELDLSLQPKLLRALENREIKRVGGDRSIKVDVRVVAATNRDLRAMINQGTFREDLYYRISVIHVILPPLRDRREDIPLIVKAFLDDFGPRRFPGENKKFSVTRDAMDRLMSYAWPGNVRELRNVIERAASLADGLELTTRDFALGFRGQTLEVMPLSGHGGGGGSSPAEMAFEEGIGFKEAKQRVVDAFEASYLRALLSRHGGNITRSAQEAGLTRYHLRELLKRHGIQYSGE
jgi:transcriptional regulator with GAF, ATPase, and Fis domain